MGSKHPDSLRIAIAKAAANIPFEFMMVSAAEEARELAHRYRDAGVNETDILSDIVAAVIARREADAKPAASDMEPASAAPPPEPQ